MCKYPGDMHTQFCTSLEAAPEREGPPNVDGGLADAVLETRAEPVVMEVSSMEEDQPFQILSS